MNKPPDFDQNNYFAALGESQFLQVRWCYYGMMPDTVAPLYAYLISRRNYRHIEAAENDEWFRCSAREVERRFRISYKMQSQRFAKLRRLHLIQVQERGVPRGGRCRWVKIDAWQGFLLLREVDPTLAATVCPNGYAVGMPKRVYPNGDGKVLDTKYVRTKVERRSAGTPTPLMNGHIANGKPSTPDEVRAKKLKDAAQTLPGYVANWKIKIQAKEIATLRRQVSESPGAPEGLVDSVLDWYCEQLPKMKPSASWPVATSPAQFRKCWSWIYGLYQKAMGNTAPEPTKLDKTPRQIVDELTAHYRWPKNSAADLPAAVQRSWEAYRNFCRGRAALVADLEDRGKGDGILAGFGQALNGYMLKPREFIQEWFEDVQRQVENWNGWRGSFKTLEFTVRHDRFEKQGREWADEYCGNAEVWNRFVTEVERAG